MGGSAWSDDVYADRAKTRAATNTPAFAYDADVKSGRVDRKIHERLDPKKVAGPTSPHAGKVMRESRDSDAHPTSLAIGVFFDETGSMGGIPVVLQKKLAGLMNLLVQKGYVEHPQILFGAIGDAHPIGSEVAPLQVGQFESGLEMEDDLTHLLLEGMGGGQHHETYEYAHYFFARHTSIDCWEKRQQKGYLFTMGDEMPYLTIERGLVKHLIGDDLEADLQLKDVIKELEERYNVFHILVTTPTLESDRNIPQTWKDLLGERCLRLEDPNNVCELIAMTIGLTEGSIDLDTGADHLKDIGTDAATIASVRKALVPLAANSSLTRSGSVAGLPDVPAGDGGVKRL